MSTDERDKKSILFGCNGVVFIGIYQEYFVVIFDLYICQLQSVNSGANRFSLFHNHMIWFLDAFVHVLIFLGR